MSAKKQKQIRKLFKKISIEMDQNDDLYDKGLDWFNDDQSHEDWYQSACHMKAIDPTLDVQVLMPDMLPHLLHEAGVIEEDEIEDLLFQINPTKLQEIVEEIKNNS